MYFWGNIFISLCTNCIKGFKWVYFWPCILHGQKVLKILYSHFWGYKPSKILQKYIPELTSVFRWKGLNSYGIEHIFILMCVGNWTLVPPSSDGTHGYLRHPWVPLSPPYPITKKSFVAPIYTNSKTTASLFILLLYFPSIGLYHICNIFDLFRPSKLGDKTQVLEILGPIKQRYPRVPHFCSSTASTVTSVFFRRIQSKKVESNCSSLCNLCKISAIKHSTILSYF